MAFVDQLLAAIEVQAFIFNGARFLLGAIVNLPFASFRAFSGTKQGDLCPKIIYWVFYWQACCWNLERLSNRSE
jgi:hypothetical protein